MSVVWFVGCGGGSDDQNGVSRAPCGAPAGDWVYLLSCDYTFGGLLHECTDFYATKSAASASSQSFRSFCTALSGKVLGGLCSAKGSTGSCVQTAASGPLASAAQGALEQTYDYDTSVSAASVQADCEQQNGVYVAADGTAPNLPAGSNTSQCKSGNGSGSGTDVFSVATYVNDQVVECTNYSGHISQAELDSLASTGAQAEPCPPEPSAICSCPQAAGAGPFGTDATLIYYKSSTVNADGKCPNDTGCVDGYSP